MYGLEKDKKKKFDFDLEADIKQNPEKRKELLDKIKQNIIEIKNDLKKEKKEELAILLNAYTSLEKVVSKIK